MANVKTAISIQKPLFEQLDALAHEMNTSRSRLIALAVEEFIRHHESRRLVERINAACGEDLQYSEQALLRRMHWQQRRLVEGEW